MLNEVKHLFIMYQTKINDFDEKLVSLAVKMFLDEIRKDA